jgi:hypothetical protein
VPVLLKPESLPLKKPLGALIMGPPYRIAGLPHVRIKETFDEWPRGLPDPSVRALWRVVDGESDPL